MVNKGSMREPLVTPFRGLNDPAEVLTTVDDSLYDDAVFVPATIVGEVRGIAGNSLPMPRESTYFHPNVLKGLVFQKYA